ncbi:MAG: tripartite tricarboxylate transporter TctB family protein [Rubrivivax sp.]
MRTTGQGPLAPRVASVLLAAAWAVAAWQVLLIPESAIQMAVGAREVPAAVAAFLGVLIAVFAASAWRGQQPDLRAEGGEEPAPGSSARVLWLLAGGASFIALVPWLGFVIPAMLCGVGVARAFDAPLSWRTFGVCAIVAGVFWLAFAAGLGVGLGPALAGLG